MYKMVLLQSLNCRGLGRFRLLLRQELVNTQLDLATGRFVICRLAPLSKRPCPLNCVCNHPHPLYQQLKLSPPCCLLIINSLLQLFDKQLS